MSPKRWIIAVIVLLLLFILASVPRLHTVESVDASDISAYPALQGAYDDLCKEYSLFDIQTGDTIQIVTVQNLWGSWKRYVLPCFAVNTPDVPTAGNADFTAFMHILSPWEKENLFTKLCPLKLDILYVSMEPGDNTMVYQLAELIPMDVSVNSRDFGLKLKQNCDKEPNVFVYYTMATLNSAKYRNQSTSSVFTWKWHLKLCGSEIAFDTITLSSAHTVNA